uniref:probable aspartic protease At2g35615 isoform X1 n=1 Tax=Fragaria vesca subsp. vesca TaxID=101020 RepID=UPI0005CA4602|nr:PREDICTED: probable aspartic protease At2g35615 isoform X1 [Fragaria vesca subsp. vesca]
MAVPRKTAMAIKSYQNQAEDLVKSYLLADPFMPYTSVIGGIFLCKLVYDLTQLISTFYIKSYASLTKIQRIEWNSRGISSIHAIFITVLSLYFVFWSDLFSDQQLAGLVTFRSSSLSVFGLGVSVGYFCADLGMLLWLYPSLGGMEYVLHHSLAGIAVAYSMFSGEGQLYTYMILISEITTPEINMRWYLDTAGMKRSSAYLINGIVIFFSWLVTRILLFGYMFYHVYLHYDQVIQMHIFGYMLVFAVPAVLAIMNLMWFGKIIKGPISTTSLVLGMRHSRSSIRSPVSSSNSKKIPSQVLDLMEPLREVRDGYLISLNLGTPPQVIQVYMDTGSDLTWVPCGNLSFSCMDCDDYRNTILNPTFSPSASSSSVRDLCGSPFCTDIHSSDNPLDPCTIAGCSLSTLIKGTCPRPCPSFAYTYGAGGVVVGTLSRDTLRVHGTSSSPSNVTSEIPSFCFGCIGSTFREPIGIAGFGRGPLSLPSQLGFLQKGFSHCFLAFKYMNNPNISSPLVIGDVAISSKQNLQFTPMLKSPIYPNNYYIGLEAITIGNNSITQVPLSLREFDSQGNGGMLIDSGTTYTHLPEPFYSDVLSVLQSLITYPRAKEMEMKTSFDLCYKVPYTTNAFTDELFPSITFHFLNNVSLGLPQGNHFYAMGAPINSTVVKCLLFQTMDDGDYGPAGVFGSFQQQNVEVVYDLQKDRIGFQAMDCASAAASQGLHKR